MALAGASLLSTAPIAPADHVRDEQWFLNTAAIDDVWAESHGEGVTVAVVDTGVDGSHPDLTGQVLDGEDFTGGGNAQADVVGHGTAMAGIIAAHGHGAKNSAGIIGLAPKAKILPLRTLQTRSDRNLDETWGPAVRYAVDHGAKVINLSFGNDGGRTLSAGREALAYAEAHDVVVVAASGNEGFSVVGDPAALPGVVSVGAVDKNANLRESSNTGKGLVLTAPGVDIVGADPTRSDGYDTSNGTSNATAFVPGTAAVVRAKYPDLTAGQVINRLTKSATFAHHKELKAPDESYGYGIVRPYSALTMDIPAGPTENPLGQLPLAVTRVDTPDESGTPIRAYVLAGGIAAVVVIGVVAVVVIRSRRNRSDVSAQRTERLPVQQRR